MQLGLSFFKNSSLTGYNQIGTVDYFALQIKMFLNNSRGRNTLYPSICNPFMNYCCSLNQHSTTSCYHLSSYWSVNSSAKYRARQMPIFWHMHSYASKNLGMRMCTDTYFLGKCHLCYICQKCTCDTNEIHLKRCFLNMFLQHIS